MAKNSELFRDPTPAQLEKSRDVVAQLRQERWSYTFLPFNVLGERVELKDPGNAGRLSPALCATFQRYRISIEILAERAYALSRWKTKDNRDTEASRFLQRSLEIFPGSRFYFQ